MGLELDSLKNNNNVYVILNNTDGSLIDFQLDFKDFKEALFDKWKINEGHIKDFFTFDELEDFFYEHDIDFKDDELEGCFGKCN